MHSAIGVISSRHETAIGDKVFIRIEAFYAVDFEVNGKCRELADTWNVQESLDVVVRDQAQDAETFLRQGFDR